MRFINQLPVENASLCEMIYRGNIFHVPATVASKQLIVKAAALLRNILGEPIREAQFRSSDAEFFDCIRRLRKAFYFETAFRNSVKEIISEFGFYPSENGFDPLRLRVVAHKGYENPRAAAVYYVHRDTWYANPQAQINWWIPIHDVTDKETFVFFPDYFERPVGNNSQEFHYAQWIQKDSELKIGWQNYDAGLQTLYPGLKAVLEGSHKVAFSCKAGDLILFSAAHLHQTLQNNTGLSRFSLDFRTVNLNDYRKGIGAPNVDNCSQAEADRLRDYIMPNETIHA